MKLIDRLSAQRQRFIDLQEVNEEDIIRCIAAESKGGNLYIRIVLKDNAYSISFLAKSQENTFQEGEEVIPEGITSKGIILWAKRPEKKKK